MGALIIRFRGFRKRSLGIRRTFDPGKKELEPFFFISVGLISVSLSSVSGEGSA